MNSVPGSSPLALIVMLLQLFYPLKNSVSRVKLFNYPSVMFEDSSVNENVCHLMSKTVKLATRPTPIISIIEHINGSSVKILY